jgi:peptidoglycan/LPS O-acetylase OafA/YrhL
LAHLWSLGVEEQFYIVWPALLVPLVRRGLSRKSIALGLAIASISDTAYEIPEWHHGWGIGRLVNGTDTHAQGLLLGCALAFAIARSGTL